MSGTAQALMQAEKIRTTLEQAGWLGLDRVSEHARALTFLLPALGWRGQAKQICEALPHMPGEIDRIDLVNSMINLGFYARSTLIHLHNADPRLTPCLFVTDEDFPLVLLPNAEKTGCEAYDPRDDSIKPLDELPDSKGTLYRFVPQTKETVAGDRIRSNVSEKPFQWFRHLIRRFDSIFIQAFAVSFLINILALASSLFVMVVYDKVIGSRSVETLRYLVFGAMLAMIMEAMLRYLRARSLAFFGVRIDAITSQLTFERLLFLPPRLIESSSIPSQVARIKDFDSIRDFFSGPTGVAVLELPFTLIFLVTIAIIGGPLAVIPVILAGCYVLLALTMLPRIQARTEEGAVAGVKRQALLVETMKKIRALKAHGLGDAWWQRYHELSGQAAMTGFASSFLSSFIEAFAYGLSVLAGISTLSFGIYLVWQGRITTGALIASMMLVWRVLMPMQAIVNSLIRIRFIFRSIAQVHKLIRTPPEGKLTAIDPELLHIKGNINFNGVGLRYTVERGPIISGMNLDVRAGEIIAITGGSGSGKTSILKLVNGLYTPQMGSILIDGLDIRQRDPIELRKNISYVPQLIELFHGTIEKNLRMVKPDATDEELMDAITWAGAREEIRNLARGIHTFIGDYRSEQLSSVFAFQLNLARGYLRDAQIMLFDEFPSSIINDTSGELFREYLQAMKGKKTILFVTDRKADVLLADRMIYLTGNGQVLAGEPAELLAALQG